MVLSLSEGAVIDGLCALIRRFWLGENQNPDESKVLIPDVACG